MSGDVKVTPLVAEILTAMVDSSADVTNRLVASLEYDRDCWKAQAELVRENIEALIFGPYAPSTRAIEMALIPRQDEIEARVERYRAEKS